MAPDDTHLELYEPNFKEISCPDSRYYDERWFESELLPQDHEWFEIIGDFLLMGATIRRYEYTGKNEQLSDQQTRHLNKFKELVPEIEDLIRGEYESLEFAQKWAELKTAYVSCGAVKKEQKNRQKPGQFDRYTEQRRAWYARVFMLEHEKGNHSKGIKYDIAKYAELIKTGKIQAPPLWVELKFEKILHEKSTINNPKLNQDLSRDMTIKRYIPDYSARVAPKFKLPPFEIKTSG